MKIPKTRKALVMDALFYGICIYVFTTVMPFQDDAFDYFGGKINFIVYSAAGYAQILLTVKIFKDWRNG